MPRTSARCSTSDKATFEHCDSQSCLLEMHGRRQAGDARSHDGYVDFDVAPQRAMHGLGVSMAKPVRAG